MRSLVVWSAVAALALGACAQSASPSSSTADDSSPAAISDAAAAPGATNDDAIAETLSSEPLRLVALGDSYTEGTGVERRDSWPQQLVRAMRHDVRLRLVANLADRNNTSEYVLEDQLWKLESLRPDVVSLLVGANDIVAPDISIEDYQNNVVAILDTLLEDLPPQRIFVITTPDHTLTVHGGDYGEREATRKAVADANAVLIAAAEARGIAVVDISPVSDRVPEDATLVAPDGLHPSAKQYAGWVEIIAPQMRRALLGAEP